MVENFLPTLTRNLLYLPCAVIVFLVLGAVRRIWFHPLSKYPGPGLYAATNLVHLYYVLRGQWVHKVLELHEKFGPVVRVAPSEISYIKSEVWGDIYKSVKGQEELKKYLPTLPKDFQYGLFNHFDDEIHGKIRKKLSPALSDRGVRDRESMLKRYANLLVEQLKKQIAGRKDAVVDMVRWYQCFSSDVTGEMLSGEPFGSFANSKVHPLVESNNNLLKTITIGTALDRSPITRNLLIKGQKLPVVPYKHMAGERLEAREAGAQLEHGDMLDALRNGQDTPTGLDRELVKEVSWDLVIAGSDTVAISLSGTTYLLLRNKSKVDRLVKEIRSQISSADEITLTNVNALKYLNAVITEAFRLWPPGPETTRRVTNAGGNVIDGEWVPPKTLVGVYHWAAGRYSRAWEDVDEFVPERWLHEDDRYAKEDHGVMNTFNIGPRNCVGMNLGNAELRLALTTMFWHFDLELQDPSDADWMKTRIFGLMVEKKPLMVRLRSRS